MMVSTLILTSSSASSSIWSLSGFWAVYRNGVDVFYSQMHVRTHSVTHIHNATHMHTHKTVQNKENRESEIKYDADINDMKMHSNMQLQLCTYSKCAAWKYMKCMPEKKQKTSWCCATSKNQAPCCYN